MAISEGYKETVTPYLLNPIPERAAVPNFLLQRGYRLSAHSVRWIWIFLYEISKLKAIDFLWNFIIYRSIKKRLTRFLQAHEIDTIVILHFLLIRPVKWVLRKKRKRNNRLRVVCGGELPSTYHLIRIVTDPYTAHHAWFSMPGIRTIVFSEGLKRLAVEKFHFPQENVLTVPPMLGEKFLPPDPAGGVENRGGKKTVLFVGGGEGLPGGVRFLKALLKSDLDLRILFVSGKDRRMRRKAEKLKSRFPAKSLTVFGFVTFLHECMAAADAVVCKAGPAVIRESLATGTPVIIIRYLYGQERGNMEYVRRNGLGYYTPDPQKMTAKLGEMMRESQAWRRTEGRVKNWRVKNGTGLVVRECILH
jgi:glycosyltransferase involved in cell wall biosynthesis